jgi:hypothetical protein
VLLLLLQLLPLLLPTPHMPTATHRWQHQGEQNAKHWP